MNAIDKNTNATIPMNIDPFSCENASAMDAKNPIDAPTYGTKDKAPVTNAYEKSLL